MNILVANSSADPIYQQITRQIKAQIISGELQEGDGLPSIRQLAKELQISVITTKRAYDELAKEGFIDLVGGKGAFVAYQNKEFLREKKIKIVEELLSKAVDEAKLMGLSFDELSEMMQLLYEEA